MAGVDTKKLKERLEEMLDKLTEANLVSKDAAAKMKEESGLLDKMVQDLDNAGMEDNDILNPQFQKKIMGTMVSESLGQKAAVQMGMETVCKAMVAKSEDPEANPLEKTLSNPDNIADKIMLDKLNKVQALHILVAEKLKTFDPTKSPVPTPEAIAKADKDLEKKLEGHDAEKKEILELIKEVEAIAKEAAEARRNAYGGDDPTVTGEIQSVITEIKTCIAGWFEPPADPNALSERVKEATESLPGNDPLGIKDKDKKSNAELATDILTPIVEEVTGIIENQNKRTPQAKPIK